MVQYAGRYRPRNATWYEDMDKGFLKAVEGVKKPKSMQSQTPSGQETSEELRVEGKDMLSRMAKNLGVKETKKDNDVKKKIY